MAVESAVEDVILFPDDKDDVRFMRSPRIFFSFLTMHGE